MESEAAAQLERQHVHEVYESTAACFSDLQGKAWPRVRQFLLEQRPGSLVADIGCGTGKYLRVNSQVYKLGCDYCGPLVDIAHSRGCEVLVCDNLRLPFRDRSFDAIISIGVIHHFSTAERRTRAVQEMARVLAPGGRVMIYVWAMEKNHRHFDQQDVFIPWNPALCSQVPAEPPGPASPGPPARPACSVCGRPPCPQKRPASRRCHSLDGSGPPGCCGKLAEGRDEGGGFYSVLGRSFRSWFFSRSLDECSLKEPVEMAAHATELAPCQPVSVQPSRLHHPDLGDLEPSAKEQGGPAHPGPAPRLRESPREPREPRTQRHGGRAAAGLSCGRTPLPPPFLSLAAAVPSGAAPPEALGSEAFTRYYHVFREGELCRLLQRHVPELQVLSSTNDHGNWCVIAEKRPGRLAQ